MNLSARPFFFGIIAAFFALIMEQIIYVIGGSSIEYELLPKLSVILLAAAAIEEAAKLAMISKSTDNMEIGIKKMILAGAIFGLGFSAAEIFLYAFNEAVSWQNSLWPLAQIAVLHITTSGLAGAAIVRTRNFPLIVPMIFLINFLIHAGYNFSLLLF